MTTDGLTVDDLRRKVRDHTPVYWHGCYGRVTRVAHDGSWADMEWADSVWHLIEGRTWRKRQPLIYLAEWSHG